MCIRDPCETRTRDELCKSQARNEVKRLGARRLMGWCVASFRGAQAGTTQAAGGQIRAAGRVRCFMCSMVKIVLSLFVFLELELGIMVLSVLAMPMGQCSASKTRPLPIICVLLLVPGASRCGCQGR